jgi:eukaryotic-like serine/threonine-protein kinase
MLTPERWQRMEDLFVQALEWLPGEREKLLADACDGDGTLQQQVLDLLRRHETPEGFMETPAHRLLDARPKPLAPGVAVGSYRVISLLGEGGMGMVYLAERADGQFDKKVAIKMLPTSATSEFLVRRFKAERQLLAHLEHPNIARLLDGGTIKSSPYLVMEYVDGQSIDVYCNQRRLGVRERLELFLQVCAAVSYAHRQWVVHRDLKPSNTLVTKEGAVKLLDFGIAKLLEPNVELTATAQRMFTPAYAAPEQVKGGELSPLTDVYALGVMLHELLTLQRLVPSTLPNRLVALPSQAVGNLDSGAWRTSNGHPAETPNRLARILHGELDAIVMKALAPSPAQRYVTVDAFASDLRNYLDGRPVGAIGRSWFYHAYKFLNRNIALVGLTAASLTLVGGFGWFLLHEQAKLPTERTIAVLPFTNMGATVQENYLVDGMTTDITTQLGKISKLTVIADRAAMRYRDSSKNLREISRELGASHLLTGSVRWAGNHLRIAVQLIEPETGRQLWAEEYDRQVKDVFAIQSEVARSIAGSLKAKLPAEEQVRLEKVPTANVTAYQYYLRGREYYNRSNPQDIEYAAQLLKEAIGADPDFALAHSELAMAYLRKFSNDAGASWLSIGCAEASKAVALAPSLAESYNALGTCYWYSGKQGKSREAYRRSIAFNPSYLPSIRNYSSLLVNHGDMDEAVRWLKKAHALDPTDAMTCQRIAYMYILLSELDQADRWLDKGLATAPDNLLLQLMKEHILWRREQFDRALQGTERVLKKEPKHLLAIYMAGNIERFQGHWSQARAYFEKALSVAADSAWSGPDGLRLSTVLAHIAKMENRPEQTLKLLAQSAVYDQRDLESGTEDFGSWCDMAAGYAIRGEREKAVSALTRAVEAGYRDLDFLEKDPLWSDLRGDTRFIQLVSKLKTMRKEMQVRVAQQEL